MIISVSRRTDIPDCYAAWFFNRLREKIVYNQNPFNKNQITEVSLKEEDVDCFVFWTKDPTKFLNRLEELTNYHYYFQITVNAYGFDLEPRMSKKRETIIRNFQELSKIIGTKKIIWRYDPIILNDKYDIDFHIRNFEQLAEKLADYTQKCIISFVDLYRTAKKNQSKHGIYEMNSKNIDSLIRNFVPVAKKYNLIIETCSEKIDLSHYGINHAKCIDNKLIGEITNNNNITHKKDPNQRKECGCVQSIDIGVYNSCRNKCSYCYANYNEGLIDKNTIRHNPNSRLLIGEVTPDMKISRKKRNLFDI